MYFRANDILIERKVLSGIETVQIAVGEMHVDNQLWVTPFPVLLHFHTPNQEHAMLLSWTRELEKLGVEHGLTLFHSLDLLIEPKFSIKIDGNLVRKLILMINEVFENNTEELMDKTWKKFDFCDFDFKNSLGLLNTDLEGQQDAKGGFITQKLNSMIVTAVLASKLSPVALENSFHDLTKRIRYSDPMKSKARKFYIERIKISSIKTDISWTGILPLSFMNLPAFFRPAFAFESLPILLRSYSDNHIYGTMEENLRKLKHHYLNIRRIADFIIGIIFKPTFMIRACFDTFHLGLTSIFYAPSIFWSSSSNMIFENNRSTYLHRMEGNEKIPFVQGQNEINNPGLLSPLCLHISKRLIILSSMFQNFTMMNSTVASFIKYKGRNLSPVANLGIKTRVGYSTRIRAPRLFANQGGKDLLVEYVEGDNVGKALLSRVRLGIYLGEGCMCHGEGYFFSTTSCAESTAFLFILTSDRLLLLDGIGNLNNCTVLWEINYKSIVLLDSQEEIYINNKDNQRHIVKITYFKEKIKSGLTGTQSNRRYTDSNKQQLGLDNLLVRILYFDERSVGSKFVREIFYLSGNKSS